MKPVSDLLTILIPTGERPHFLARLLRYASSVSFPWSIVLVDDASAASRDATSRLVKQFQSDLQLRCILLDTKKPLIRKIADALSEVQTPYTVLGADDDFFSRSGLQAALNWLSEHDDYSIVHGNAVVFHLGDELVHGPIKSVVRYRQLSNEHASASERLQTHWENYSTTWYSLERTAQLSRNWHKAAELDLDLRFGEFLPSTLSILQGKAKALSAFYFARQGHSLRVSAGDALKEFEWISSSTWASQYHRFRQCISEELMNTDRIALDASQMFVDRNFAVLIAQRLQRQIKARQRSPLRQRIASLTGLRMAAYFVKRWKPAENPERNWQRLAGGWTDDIQSMCNCITHCSSNSW